MNNAIKYHTVYALYYEQHIESVSIFVQEVQIACWCTYGAPRCTFEVPRCTLGTRSAPVHAISLIQECTPFQDMDNDAPLQWVYEALRRFGEAAVPINMLLLGSSLSKQTEKGFTGSGVTLRPRIAVTIAKLILLPAFGTLVGLALRPMGLSAGALLVAMVGQRLLCREVWMNFSS